MDMLIMVCQVRLQEKTYNEQKGLPRVEEAELKPHGIEVPEWQH